MRKRAFAPAALALMAALIPLGAAPGASAAGFTMKTAKFEVEVKGVQTVKWERKDGVDFECDVAVDGEGTEVWRFGTVKPIRMTLRQVNDIRATFNVGNGYLRTGFPIRSKITRKGAFKDFEGKVCSYGDGTGGEQVKPESDCGTLRTDKLTMGLGFQPDDETLLQLQRTGDVDQELFDNCPRGGVSAPRLLTYKGNNEQDAHIGRRLTAKTLFHGPWQKHIVIAGGTYRTQHGGTIDSTTVRWEVSLERLGKTKTSRS